MNHELPGARGHVYGKPVGLVLSPCKHNFKDPTRRRNEVRTSKYEFKTQFTQIEFIKQALLIIYGSLVAHGIYIKRPRATRLLR